MSLDNVKKAIAQLRGSYDPKDPDEGHVRMRIGQLEDLVRDVEQTDRVALAATLDVAGVSRRMKELQDADKRLGVCASAQLRAHVELETDALDRRVAELNQPAGSSSPGVDPLAAQRQAIRDTHNRLGNPLAQAAFRLRNEWAFDENEATS